jgi:L-amino acid N-acyltransferase YncA
MQRGNLRLRPAQAADLPAIQEIYSHHVRTGLASFEEVPPDLQELGRRREEVMRRGLPYLVAEGQGGVQGYAYASPYRTRSGYRNTLEDSIYVSPDAVGRGIGKMLLAELLVQAEALGYRQMVAIIGDSANHASIGLHRSLGFREAGVLRSIGYKLGRWVDSVLMQRALGAGDTAPPIR